MISSVMKGWIANTHHGWFDFLARKPYWPEVNFWTPSDYYAFRGEPGSPFFLSRPSLPGMALYHWPAEGPGAEPFEAPPAVAT